MKFSMHALHALLVLSLLGLSPVSNADPRPSRPTHSFKGGFSSQRAATPPPRAPRQDAAPPRGGFGSFNSAPARNGQKSDSALSQRLDKNASEANALRTLDARRAAQDQAARDTRPVPGYENRQNNGQYSGQNNGQYNAPMPAQPQPSGNGLGGVVTGMVLGQIASGAHARNNNGYPGQVTGSTNVGTSSATVHQAPQRSFFGGVLRMFMWLIVLSAIGWLVYFMVQKKRRKTEENKPNYTFEGQ
jgi:hypothetical protein